MVFRKTHGKPMGKPWENEDFVGENEDFTGFVWEFCGIHMV